MSAYIIHPRLASAKATNPSAPTESPTSSERRSPRRGTITPTRPPCTMAPPTPTSVSETPMSMGCQSESAPLRIERPHVDHDLLREEREEERAGEPEGSVGVCPSAFSAPNGLARPNAIGRRCSRDSDSGRTTAP